MTRAAHAQERWIRAFVGLYLEVEAGLRPARHIRPMMALDLQPVVGNCGRQGRIPDVLAVRLQSRRGVCEAVILLDEEDRVSALAVAIRREEQGWRIAEVRRPDGPPRPLQSEADPQPLAQTTWHELSSDAASPTWGMPNGWRGPSPELPVRAA